MALQGGPASLEMPHRASLDGIHWVIVGGESGPGARPMKPEWVRRIRDNCRTSRVPFLFKQWGGVRKEAGRTLDGRTHNDFPSWRVSSPPSAVQRELQLRSLDEALTAPFLPADVKF